MTDRIRELANQVERIRDLYNIGPVHRDAVEQFAELIVRDVIEELESSKKGDIYTGDLVNCEWNDCIDHQINVLKEKFGVQE